MGMVEAPMNIDLDLEELETLRALAVERVEECIGIARRNLGREITMPEVRFNLRGKTAGYGGAKVIRLNIDLLMREGLEFIARTPGHEAAHTVVHQLWPSAPAHGERWKTIMRLFGQAPSRCHSFQTTPVRKERTVAYACNCRTFDIGIRRHKRIMQGATYHCLACKGTIERIED